MEIVVKRTENLQEETLGEMTVNNIKVCTLEDKYQANKVKGETRIPEGRYEIKFRNIGGHNDRYLQKFPDIHKGMLWLQNVPNFQYILIHIGNTKEDTDGCLLVGTGKAYWTENNTKRAKITGSTDAYKKIYPIIANALEKERVFITIK